MAISTHPKANILDNEVLQDVVDGNLRMTSEQASKLYNEMPLIELGRWADARCRVLHGDQLRTYIVDRNINYTNICTAKCTFCAFRRDGHEEDAYTLTYDELLQKVQPLANRRQLRCFILFLYNAKGYCGQVRTPRKQPGNELICLRNYKMDRNMGRFINTIVLSRTSVNDG